MLVDQRWQAFFDLIIKVGPSRESVSSAASRISLDDTSELPNLSDTYYTPAIFCAYY